MGAYSLKILVINAGSTSVKFRLFDMETSTVVAEGNCQKVGRQDSELKFVKENGGKTLITLPLLTHGDALLKIIEMLTSGDTKIIENIREIGAVAHRVSMGGPKYLKTVEVTEDVILTVEGLSDITPLHNPPQAKVMRACREIFGADFPMAVGFDTAFNATIPLVAHIYPVPYRYYEQHQFRKYGFHGLSHQFVSERCAELSGRDPKGTRVISCHLGGGSSVCAIKDGISIDNSFGIGTGQGPACGTRAGTIDHAGIGYLMKRENITYDEAEEILHRESGLLGLSGISSDEKEIEDAAANGDARAQLTLDVMAYQIKNYIGSYAFAMGGLDTVIFTGGIGENSDFMRAKICDGLSEFGIVLDENANVKFNRREHKISAATSKVDIWIIPTNEEYVIARDAQRLFS